MSTYEVIERVTITAEPGSIVQLTDEQAECVKQYIKPKSRKTKEVDGK